MYEGERGGGGGICLLRISLATAEAKAESERLEREESGRTQNPSYYQINGEDHPPGSLRTVTFAKGINE